MGFVQMRLGMVAVVMLSAISSTAAEFEAPDTRVPYACTFHWFTLDDGSTVGLDLIRSDKSTNPAQVDQRGLRVFHIPRGGSAAAPKRLVYVAPTSAWQSMFTGPRPSLPAGKVPFLARGKGWVMASVNLADLGVSPEGDQITSVAFDLDVIPEPDVQPRLNGDILRGITSLGEFALRLEASDYVRVRTRGQITIDGVNHWVVDSLGPASVHFGDALPDYGYVVVVPGMEGAGPSNLLISSVHNDAIKIPRPIDSAFTYAYGDRELPGRAFRITGRPKNRVVPIGLGRKIVLSDIAPSKHLLLGVETWTATARATYVERLFPWQWFKAKTVELGSVVLDFRGEYFVKALRQ